MSPVAPLPSGVDTTPDAKGSREISSYYCDGRLITWHEQGHLTITLWTRFIRKMDAGEMV